MPHGANAARRVGDVVDTAQHGSHVVTMLEGGDELVALIRIVAQPVQKLGKTPFGGVGSAAPLNGQQTGLMRFVCNFSCFTPGTVVTPEIVIIQRLQILADRNDAGPGGIQRQGLNGRTRNTSRLNCALNRKRQCRHVVFVALSGEIRIFAFAVKRIFGDTRAQPALFAVEDRNADAESSEINSGDDGAHALCQYISQPRYFVVAS